MAIEEIEFLGVCYNLLGGSLAIGDIYNNITKA